MAFENQTKNILVAPLNWGLGHATRCIPIIRALELNGFVPILASDGVALAMLKKEFPHLKALELPSYEIEYAKKGANFKWKLFKNMPTIIEAVLNEKKLVKTWIKEFQLAGIISDNRLGVFHKKTKSVFITHQLNVITGNTTWLSSKLHQRVIRKFDECWVPDFEGKPNLSGKLGHLKKPGISIKYIGPLSRFEKKILPKKYALMVILSGPEPQRTYLEDHLKETLPDFDGNIIFIKGKIESEQKTEQSGNITFYNFMASEQLEQTFNESEKVLCRSGYTTIMDLAKLGKKAFFIPTPGQYEQEYLAKKFWQEGLAPFVKQHDFKVANLLEIDRFEGLPTTENHIGWNNLFRLFERK